MFYKIGNKDFLLQVYSWGSNNFGQVGIGTTTTQPTPCKVTATIGKVLFALPFYRLKN